MQWKFSKHISGKGVELIYNKFTIYFYAGLNDNSLEELYKLGFIDDVNFNKCKEILDGTIKFIC